jgi:hypothetical protein
MGIGMAIITVLRAAAKRLRAQRPVRETGIYPEASIAL